MGPVLLLVRGELGPVRAGGHPHPSPGNPLAEHRDPGLQLVFLLRFRPHCPVPWKSSNSSSTHPLEPSGWRDHQWTGRPFSAGVNALMSLTFIMNSFSSLFFLEVLVGMVQFLVTEHSGGRVDQLDTGRTCRPC